MRKLKPTVVLVHGAFADSSSWNDVVGKLQADGYDVIAASNPLRGLHGDALHVRQLVAGIDGPVVLVGHSYGGAVITNAAGGLDNVRALVYVAAFMPDGGESALELAGKFPGSTLGEVLRPVPVTLADGREAADLYIEQGRFHHQFAADVPEGRAVIMAATQRPVSNVALEDASSTPAWRGIPSWVLIAAQDRNIPPRTQAWMAERAGATTVEIDASHAVSVSRPAEVTRLIDAAARATA
ncbi:alpha/beta fold hydrolase [Streptomyces sp. NPDC089424]|uniref:alpha/beta fold hydrolase n=1 Tax=Streptomyces sp. NPDC089424 TaxID=3365917 RepID=UPI0037FC4F89